MRVHLMAAGLTLLEIEANGYQAGDALQPGLDEFDRGKQLAMNLGLRPYEVAARFLHARLELARARAGDAQACEERTLETFAEARQLAEKIGFGFALGRITAWEAFAAS